jgi:hypothetical protein
VKTELVMQTWRHNVLAGPHEIVQAAHEVFGPHTSAAENQRRVARALPRAAAAAATPPSPQQRATLSAWAAAPPCLRSRRALHPFLPPLDPGAHPVRPCSSPPPCPLLPLPSRRFNELVQASTNPHIRIGLESYVSTGAVLSNVLRFAAQAQAALGPPLVRVIQDDINAGRYLPGQPPVPPAPAPPAPPATDFARFLMGRGPAAAPAPGGPPSAPRYPYEGPDDGGYGSPVQLSGGAKRRFDHAAAGGGHLDAAREALRKAGGADPLAAALDQAAAAAPAGRARRAAAPAAVPWATPTAAAVAVDFDAMFGVRPACDRPLRHLCKVPDAYPTRLARLTAPPAPRPCRRRPPRCPPAPAPPPPPRWTAATPGAGAPARPASPAGATAAR